MEQENSNTEAVMKANSSFAFKGIAEVFYDPSGFFKKLKDNPKILVPYVMFLIITVITLFFLQDLIVEQQLSSPFTQRQLEATGLTITPQYIEQQKTPD